MSIDNDIQTQLEAIRAQFRIDQHIADSEIRRNSIDGVAWYDAPVPSRFHLCWVQTTGWVGLFDQVQRCACGAIRNPGISRWWMEKNSRRKGEVKP